MNFTNLFRIAVKALSNNKLRGFLTMLGIIIGVASVITMLAIGQGSKRSIQAEISEMGSNMIMVHPGGDRRGGVQLSADDMQSLKIKDFEDIRADTRYVTYVSPAVNSSGQAVYGANNTPTTVYGVNLDYLDIRRYKVDVLCETAGQRGPGRGCKEGKSCHFDRRARSIRRSWIDGEPGGRCGMPAQSRSYVSAGCAGDHGNFQRSL